MILILLYLILLKGLGRVVVGSDLTCYSSRVGGISIQNGNFAANGSGYGSSNGNLQAGTSSIGCGNFAANGSGGVGIGSENSMSHVGNISIQNGNVTATAFGGT
jgi:hypothetical protein